MQRQQRFLAALIERATSSGVLLNPMKFRDVTRAVLGSVRADKGFGTDELLDLGRAMRDFSPSSSEFTTVPIGQMGYAVKGIGSTLKWDEQKADRALPAPCATTSRSPRTKPRSKALRVDVAPQQIRVQVENGTATPRASAARRQRARRHRLPHDPGARQRPRPHAPAHDRPYDPRWDRSAKSLAAALPGSELRAVKGRGPLLKVIAGADFKQVQQVRAEDPTQGEFGVVTGDQVVCP